MSETVERHYRICPRGRGQERLHTHGTHPDHELQRLKEEESVQCLVAASGVELKKCGKDWLGRCPFHGPDTEPSLNVSASKNLWNCFGCGIGGGPIDWVIKSRGVSLLRAHLLVHREFASQGVHRRAHRPQPLEGRAQGAARAPRPEALAESVR